MTQIKAFVGHSFEEEDAGIVRTFLHFFDQLSQGTMSFSWEHAETAEPRLLAEKVMSLIADKNLFIGICTKREYAIASGDLAATYFPRNNLRGEEAKFEWKTSDWVIQEIGLAKGKNLHLILLIERGVRKPGGLQGDVEYINFDRGAPEKAFGKIVEMLNALSPATSSAAATSPDSTGVTQTMEMTSQAEGDLWSIPQLDWSRARYELAFHLKTITDDDAGAELINQAYFKSLDAQQADRKDSWVAYVEYTRLSTGKRGTLNRLETLAEEHPHSSGTLEQLGQAFRHYEDYEKSSQVFEKAAREAKSPDELIRLLGLAALDYNKADQREKVSGLESEIKSISAKATNAKVTMLSAMRSLYSSRKDDDCELAIMECIMESEPNDTYTRFALAYKYSERGSNDLALFHYLRIPYVERNRLTWNNLGVAYDKFSMPGKSVQAYRAAKRNGETLAMSNLANKFVLAGFFDEAQKECDEALSKDHYHENIGRDLAKIKSTPDRETEVEIDLVKKTKSKSDFYRQFGHGLTRPDVSGLSGFWDGPSCPLEVVVEGSNFLARGSYEAGENALMNALAGLSAVRKGWRVILEYKGRVRGGGIEGHLSRIRDGSIGSQTLLGELGSPRFLMFLSEDGNELRVMENPASADPNFYGFKRR